MDTANTLDTAGKNLPLGLFLWPLLLLSALLLPFVHGGREEVGLDAVLGLLLRLLPVSLVACGHVLPKWCDCLGPSN